MAKPKVVPFRLSDPAAKRLLHQVADDTSRVIFTDHAKAQMRKRKITPVQVINCLKKGRISESPVLDHHGNWKLTIERYACGEQIGCAVAIDMSGPKAIVITAFWVD